MTSGGGGPTSRRSTRSGGTRASCSSGGSANPASTASAALTPIPSGARLAGGSVAVPSSSRTARSSHSCATKPIADPATEASSATITSCSRLTLSVKPRVAPRVFSKATASRCRRTYCRADIATAMEHSRTLTRLASVRKRPARSTAFSSCGLASLTSRIRSAGRVCSSSHGRNARMTRRIGGEQAGVTDAAAGLDQLRRRQILQVHDQGGCQIRQVGSLVGPRDQHPGDLQGRGADRQLRADSAAERRAAASNWATLRPAPEWSGSPCRSQRAGQPPAACRAADSLPTPPRCW